jgi:hypothetical protein
MMTLAEFEHFLDLHGPDIAAWPEQRRADAKQLAQGSSARTVLEHALRIEEQLRQLAEPIPLSAAQLGRLASGLEARRARVFDPLLLLGTRRNLVAAMSLAIAVFGFGAWTGTLAETPTAQVDLAALDLEAAGIVIEP